MNNLILEFPILKPNNMDFIPEIGYEVQASQKADEIMITHTLTGHSFIADMLKAKQAYFCVSSIYKDSSERQYHPCRHDEILFNHGSEKITAQQAIKKEFSYNPGIIPSIVSLQEHHLRPDTASGLTDFWQGREIVIPKMARVALHPRLTFNDGSLSSLIKVECDDDYRGGTMKVTVNEDANEGDPPITITCAKDLHDELKRFDSQNLKSNSVEILAKAVITHALSVLYTEMKEHYRDKNHEDYQEGGVLAAHAEKLQKELSANWRDENFCPSLVATQMCPYLVKPVTRGGDDE